MDGCLGVLVLGEIVTEALQGKLDMARPHELGRRGFQDGSDFIGQRGILQKVGSLRAGLEVDSLALAESRQGLKRLANEDDSPLRFLLFGNQIGQFLLGGFVGLLILGELGHAAHYKQA